MVGRRCGVGRQTLDQLDNLKSFPGRKFQEGCQQSQAFNSFARWSPELRVQFRNRRRIFHLAPLMENANAIQGKREAWLKRST
jgi:hypothetical protein